MRMEQALDGKRDVVRHGLDAIFKPRTVAVIGATEKEDSVGRTIVWNLISNPFGGTVYPVNPNRPSVLGIRTYKNIAEIPEQVDLAVIVTPARTVPGIVEECISAGVPGCIIISAGFKEIGEAGAALEQQILNTARGKMRIIGPNCLGVMNPTNGLNATFAGAMARPGNVGFISQSGALCTSVLDWSFQENVGFSAFISIGSMLDVSWGDLIYYLGEDERTRSIVIYMESVGDARSFLSAAREVALRKPIIVIKAGKTEAAAHAAASHTGALTGSDEVLEAAFRRVGVLRVNHISDIFYTSEVFAKQPRAKGRRLTILTNAGGPGVLTTDSLISEGGELAELAPETIEALNKILPEHWSHSNPVDILGDAGPQRYAQALEIAAKDPNSDGLLVILTPQAMSDPTQTAEQLKAYANLGEKPLLASWMGGAEVAAGESILNRANIPTFAYPDTAVRLFNYMWRYTYNLRGIYETPIKPVATEEERLIRQRVANIIEVARANGRTILTEFESKQVLSAYGIPTNMMMIAETEEDAVAAANEIGYPVVIKIHSETITHKTDVGGVKLNLGDEEAVRQAYRDIQEAVTRLYSADDFLGVAVQPMEKLDGYEIIIGSSIDPQFGPVLLFGMGGILVEVFKDRSLGLPPLNTTLARRMMEQTKIYTALKGVRGRKSVNMELLEEIMVRFSQLIVEQRWIKEMDINPLLASENRLIALDARVLLHDPAMSVDQLPKLAIRPYPVEYAAPFTMRNNTEVMIRPIRPEDEPLAVKFHESLSEQTVYLRYFYPMKLSQRVSHERLSRLSFIDYDREMALVVIHQHPETGEDEMLGVGRLTRTSEPDEAEFALVVTDRVQRQGLGRELLHRLIDIGKKEGLKRIFGHVLPANDYMLHIAEELDFKIHRQFDSNIVKAELEL